MKRYDVFAGAKLEREGGSWVPAEVAQALYDALKAQIDLSEYWINSYLSLSKSRLGGTSESDYRMWLATGHRSNAMANSRKALSMADGEE